LLRLVNQIYRCRRVSGLTTIAESLQCGGHSRQDGTMACNEHQ